MRVLVIDHEDSFLWNLVQLLGARLGAWPRVLGHLGPWEDVARELESGVQLLVLGPGPGHPARARDAGVTPRLLSELDSDVSVFGVCFGLQAIVQHFGGALRESDQVVHGKSSRILHHGRGLFAGLPAPVSMMRYHSWVADETRLPGCLAVLATTESGEIMAVGHDRRPIQAVQFHPESVGSEHGPRLLENVLDWARGNGARRTHGATP